MKKNKSTEQQPGDFKNNPFKALKSVKPAAAPAPAKKPPAPSKKENETSEAAEQLFLRAVAGARAISDAGPVKEPAPEKPAGTPAAEGRDEEQLFLQAMQQIGTTFLDQPARPEEDAEAPRQSASGRMRQLKRGTIRISEQLDLHGYLKVEALARLEHFIAAAYSRGLKAVLVITGKGINSPEGPVLQGAVAGWLRTKGKDLVAEFAPAPRDLGGSGAVVVFLKSRQAVG